MHTLPNRHLLALTFEWKRAQVTAAHLAGLTDPLLSALAACLQPSQQLPPAVQEATLEGACFVFDR